MSMCIRNLLACVLVSSVGVAFAKPSFYLPAHLYAAPGLECNVYFKNIFDSIVPQNYAFHAVAKKGKSECTRWCWTPTAEDAGTSVQLVVNAWNDDGLVAAVTTTVEVATAAQRPDKKITFALFGDSLTNCRFQDRIFADMKEAGYAGYQPIGARAQGGVPHDGYGGYTCSAFLTRYRISNEEWDHIQDAAEREQLKALGMPEKIVHAWQRDLLRSPLVQFKDGKKVVDVPAWLKKANEGKAPDVVLIELGVNNVFSFQGEAAELRARIRTQVMPSFTEFVSTLKPFMPHAHFALVTQPNGCSQDGFAANYGASWNEIQHRKIIFALNRELEAWAQEQGVDLVPVGQGVDPFYGFIHAAMPAHACSKEKVIRDRNAVHPSAEGGLQMGDAIAAWLCCRWNDLTK